MIRHAKSITALTLIGALSACGALTQRPGEKLPLKLLEVPPPPQEPEQAAGETAPPAKPALQEAEITLGTGQTIRPPSQPRPPRKPGNYTLNFDDADLGEVAKVILGDILKTNYVLSPRAAGKITLQTTRPLNREEVLPALELVLRMNGLALVKKGDFYWIGPLAEASKGAPLSVAGRTLPPGFQVRIYPLRYIGVKSLEKILPPLLSPKALLYADPVRNLLLVAGTSDELTAADEVVRTFDVNFLKGMSVGLFPLHNLDAETLRADLESVLGKKVLEDDSILRLIPIDRLNALMVITRQPEYLQLAQTWINRLDRAVSEEAGSVHVYRAQNVDAKKLAETLNQIFTGNTQAPKTQVAPGRRKVTLKGRSRPQTTARRTQTPLRIIADEPNNALIIIASQEQYREIEKVIKDLDRLPLQVLIDASIIEVTLTDDLQYGLEWFAQNKLPKQHSTAGFSSNGLNLGDAAKTALLNSLAPGFSYVWQSKSQDIGIILKAAAEKGKLNVISSPSLMVLNNHEATITVGEQISLQTSQATNTATSGNNPIITATFQQRDTGVQLKIKPRVNTGGLVIMELDQKVDDIGRRLEGSPNPNIIQRQIKSTVAVKNGDTLVLGGLIKDNRNKSRSGIPFLYKLPLIGHLFGTTTENINRTELVVLITPRVVENRRDAFAVTNEFRLRLKELYQTPEEYLKQPSQPRREPEPATPAAKPGSAG
ncbi:general secretion pathway protein D [Methylomarinovum caldicuralii]|uniref:General secretion pathway protein D n=1 Tax=Methylomarinovum caldicuralii TaxID=438856 RepID=A0AAU9C236_9GAMM|nr:type II secretion system secretin GspD [Methylomarinovum caldicuralii]BCX82427.1 general secretion pathway protein D [Methylomarinovum caldicuralii]